jgi:thioredoxin-related protein
MKQLVIIPILVIANAMQVCAQPDSTLGHGINFEKNSSWEEILQRAQKENKYIFVDCYASWCGPCKWMDKNVYSSDTVGRAINAQFLSVQIQMDTTQHDNDETKNLYATAHMLGEQYHVRAYPSYLFFSPDGRSVHKAMGARDVEDFMSLMKMAQDPQHQYYTLLDRYGQGRMEYAELPALVQTAEEIGEDSLVRVLAKDYLFNYLVKMHRGGKWSIEDLAFMRKYVRFIHYGDPLFRRYFSERRVIDSILGGPGKSDGLINAVVYQDEVLPKVNDGIGHVKEPNWRRIGKRITTRYGSNYAASNLLKGHVEYYKARKEWAEYSKYFIKQIEASDVQNWPAGVMVSHALNNDAYEVFLYSLDKEDLEKALAWADRALSMNGNDPITLDTKANLLYKLGRKSEGLALEEQSYKRAPNDKGIEANYTKMKSGLPTWE